MSVLKKVNSPRQRLAVKLAQQFELAFKLGQLLTCGKFIQQGFHQDFALMLFTKRPAYQYAGALTNFAKN